MPRNRRSVNPARLGSSVTLTRGVPGTACVDQIRVRRNRSQQGAVLRRSCDNGGTHISSPWRALPEQHARPIGWGQGET